MPTIVPPTTMVDLLTSRMVFIFYYYSCCFVQSRPSTLISVNRQRGLRGLYRRLMNNDDEQEAFFRSLSNRQVSRLESSRVDPPQQQNNYFQSFQQHPYAPGISQPPGISRPPGFIGGAANFTTTTAWDEKPPPTKLTMEELEARYLNLGVTSEKDSRTSSRLLSYGVKLNEETQDIETELQNAKLNEETQDIEKELKRAARVARFFWEPLGTMTVEPSRAGPNQFIQVNWVLPMDQVGAEDDWIGLFRARTRVDATDGFILNRKVDVRPRIDNKTRTVHGYIKLRTPRGVGNYDFRYFKGGDMEGKTILPIARSNTVSVEVQGSNLFEALDFIQRNLSDRKKVVNAIVQFSTLIRQLESLSIPNITPRSGKPRTESQEVALYNETWDTIDTCIAQMQSRYLVLNQSMEHTGPEFESARDRFREMDDIKKGLQTTRVDDVVPEGMMSDEDFGKWKLLKDTFVAAEKNHAQNVRERASLSSALNSVLISVRDCPPFRNMMKKEHSKLISDLLALYCPVEEYFFESHQHLIDHYELSFNMRFRSTIQELQVMVDLEKIDQKRMQALTKSAVDLSHSMMPDVGVEATRMNFIEELQRMVNQVTTKWNCDAKLMPFGSSLNNFGTNDSDLDISLVFFKHGAKWPDALSEEGGYGPNPQEAVADLARLMAENGFQNIDDSRKTARIPVLQFRNPALELDCDICIDNRLAIRNTLLLRTYSLVDIRVRELAYIIKRWSKRRNINNPAERTLSSYGYILLLIHYLQSTQVPVLPALQSLPGSWDGSTLYSDNLNTHRQMVLVASQDGKQHDTYFYGDPHSSSFSSNHSQLLSNFATKNTDSVGQLLLGFFWTYGLSFDWRRNVIGIRDNETVLKETKANEDSWKLHQRMAIEDPFETGYDVAHVVRDKEFQLIRSEFVRAYALLSGSSIGINAKFEDIIDIVWEQK